MHLYHDLSSDTGNFENLFDLTNADGGDPDESSLFNIQTLKQFVEMGDDVPNIIKTPIQVYGETFNLPDTWTVLAQKLKLDDEKQLYMIWLWLETALELTFLRTQDGGDN